MPSSYAEGKQTIVGWLNEIKPTTALDIGPGCGTYQHLVSGVYGSMVNVRNKETGEREWDLGADGNGEFVDFKGPACRFVGIEAYYPYVSRWNLKDRYEHIVVADVRFVDWNKIGLLNGGVPFTVAFCGDVLEHLSVEEAQFLLEWLEFYSNNIIVSIPIVPFPQGEFEGNPFERHVVEDWTHDKVVEAFGTPHKFFNGNHIGTYWYRNV